MTPPELALDDVNAVIKGTFSVGVVTPTWLYKLGLVGVGELESLEIEVVTPEFSIFTMDWLRVQIGIDHLQISTSSAEDFERSRDVAEGILRALPETPVLALGINRNTHLRLESAEQLFQLGDRLAPKDPWNGILSFAGLTAYRLVSGRDDSFDGVTTLHVESSARIPMGVFVLHNDHYSLKPFGGKPTAREQVVQPAVESLAEASTERNIVAREILESDWQNSFRRSSEILNRINMLAKA